MKKHRASLAIAILLWSTSFPVIKWALFYTGPGPLLALRFVLAGLGVLFLFAMLRRPFPWRVLRKKEMLVMALSNAMGFALQFFGQDLTTASKAALFINTYVVFVALVAPVFLKERIAASTAFGVILGFMGAGMISTGLDPSFMSKGSFAGDMMCVGAALVYTVYIVLSKKLVDSGWGVLEIAFGTMLLTAPLTFPFVFVGIGSFNWITVGVGAYLGIFCSLIPFILYIYSLQGISAIVSSVMFLGEVVLAVLWSFVFLRERLGLAEWAGAGLVLSAILLAGVRGNRKSVST